MKPRIAFTIADEKNIGYARKLENSLRKFHSAEELPLMVIGPEQLKEMKDPAKFYRMTPFIAKPLMDEYELVLKLDADMIITGSLDYVLNQDDYDIGGVLNFNRLDAKEYGPVGVWDISPLDYMNCGFVAMRSKRFVEHWYNLCFGPHFDAYQYREQDLLNILYYYGDYRTKCFDHYDQAADYSAWHGLLSKGEWPKVVMDGDKLMLRKAEDEYPSRDVEIKCLHWAGGNVPNKLNYRIHFSDEVCKRLDYLTSDEKQER